MALYRVTIKGQFEYTTDVDGESPEDAKDWAMVDLDNTTDDVRFVIINSMEVATLDAATPQ